MKTCAACGWYMRTWAPKCGYCGADYPTRARGRNQAQTTPNRGADPLKAQHAVPTVDLTRGQAGTYAQAVVGTPLPKQSLEHTPPPKAVVEPTTSAQEAGPAEPKRSPEQLQQLLQWQISLWGENDKEVENARERLRQATLLRQQSKPLDTQVLAARSRAKRTEAKLTKATKVAHEKEIAVQEALRQSDEAKATVAQIQGELAEAHTAYTALVSQQLRAQTQTGGPAPSAAALLQWWGLDMPQEIPVEMQEPVGELQAALAKVTIMAQKHAEAAGTEAQQETVADSSATPQPGESKPAATRPSSAKEPEHQAQPMQTDEDQQVVQHATASSSTVVVSKGRQQPALTEPDPKRVCSDASHGTTETRAACS